MLPGSTQPSHSRDHHGFNADEPRERSITSLSSMQTMEPNEHLREVRQPRGLSAPDKLHSQ
jgi:hypothetical protein